VNLVVARPCTSLQIVEQTNDPGVLPLYNPATVRVGYYSGFIATVAPSNCSVQWTVSGAGHLSGPPNASSVTFNGDSIGNAVLTATGAGGLQSTITVPVKQQTTLKVRMVIVRASDGTSAATTDADAMNDLANANAAWVQGSIQFELDGSIVHLDNSDFLTTDSDATRSDLVGQFQNTGAFEVY